MEKKQDKKYLALVTHEEYVTTYQVTQFSQSFLVLDTGERWGGEDNHQPKQAIKIQMKKKKSWINFLELN